MFRFTADAPPTLPAQVLEGPLLRGVRLDQRVALLSAMTYHEADANSEIFGEDEPGDSLWIVLRGVVSLTRKTAAGELLELDRAHVGEPFGEMSVISPAPRSATATTLGECELLSLQRARFRAMLQERNPAAEALLRFVTLRMCRRLRQVDSRIALVHDLQRGASKSELAQRVTALNLLSVYA